MYFPFYLLNYFFNRLYLASLKDLPLKSALKNVYLIPENVGVHLVNYNLPKSAQFLSRDVLRYKNLSFFYFIVF